MDNKRPSMRLDGVSKSFGSYNAVTGVSETFSPGELICIIGPNGAGKSTLLNMICGTLSVTSGSISLDGVELAGLAPEKIAALGVARKFQTPSVFESLTVFENLCLAGAGRDQAGWLDSVVEKVQLAGDRDVCAGDLPHGKKQWLEIGMALATRPKVLLLDEPTAGLSVDETRQTAQFLKELSADVTVIVIEHDMAFVRELGGRTIVLHHGEIIASGPFAMIESDEMVRDVYLGRR